MKKPNTKRQLDALAYAIIGKRNEGAKNLGVTMSGVSQLARVAIKRLMEK